MRTAAALFLLDTVTTFQLSLKLTMSEFIKRLTNQSISSVVRQNTVRRNCLSRATPIGTQTKEVAYRYSRYNAGVLLAKTIKTVERDSVLIEGIANAIKALPVHGVGLMMASTMSTRPKKKSPLQVSVLPVYYVCMGMRPL
jgi:hypothetical protein